MSAITLPATAQDADPAPADTADAQPTPTPIAKPKMPSGPSAKMAAELKREPPPAPDWVAHYLPDDRYKVAGGIWKYVSTELDTYYHYPNSPLMMSQPANMVIGFPDQKTAEEAGYRPDRTIAAKIKVVEVQKKSGAAEPKLFDKASTITINDGESKVTVPAGWRYYPLNSGAQKLSIFLPKTTKFDAGQFTAERDRKPPCVVIITQNAPGNINVESMLDSSNLAKLMAQRNEAMAGLAGQNWEFQGRGLDATNTDLSPSNWGGAKAVRAQPKKGSKFSFGANSLIYAARGSKIYMYFDWTNKSKGASQIRNSFVAR